MVAIGFGFFTFIWMAYDFLSNRKIINQDYLVANDAFLNKDYKKALKFYDLALKDDPKNIYLIEGKARSTFRMGNFIEAEKLFKIVIQQDKNFVPALANLGILYDTLGEYENAVAAAEEGFALAQKHNDSEMSRVIAQCINGYKRNLPLRVN